MSKKSFSPEVEALVQERHQLPDEEYQAAQLWLAVDQARQQASSLHSVAEKNLQSATANTLVRIRVPEHKIHWMAEAMDIILRALEAAETIGITEMHRLFGYSGMFAYRQEDEWARKQYENPSNWKTRNTYGDEIERYYVGRNERQMNAYLQEGSRFSLVDVNQICQDLWSQGVIYLTPDRRWALASAKR